MRPVLANIAAQVNNACRHCRHSVPVLPDDRAHFVEVATVAVVKGDSHARLRLPSWKALNSFLPRVNWRQKGLGAFSLIFSSQGGTNCILTWNARICW